MPAYVEFESDPQIPPPYDFPGVTIRSFRLNADVGRLQALCDRCLNIGSLAARGFEFRALLPFVDLEFLTYPRMSYGVPPYSEWGSATQQELYFRFFVAKYVLVGGWFLLPAPVITSFFPYIFVDNSWSLITGREVIGFPKLLADFHDGGPDGPYPIDAATLTIDSLSPSATVKMRNFVTISAAATTSPVAVQNSWALSEGDLAMLKAASVLQEAVAPGILRSIHLRQLRDLRSPEQACYQSIVEGEFTARNFRAFSMPPAEILLKRHDTLSIAATLGLGADERLRPISQFAATCDLRYTGAATIFENT
jgi:Acetoacetate decarboxylase (ADC)